MSHISTKNKTNIYFWKIIGPLYAPSTCTLVICFYKTLVHLFTAAKLDEIARADVEKYSHDILTFWLTFYFYVLLL